MVIQGCARHQRPLPGGAAVNGQKADRDQARDSSAAAVWAAAEQLALPCPFAGRLRSRGARMADTSARHRMLRRSHAHTASHLMAGDLRAPRAPWRYFQRDTCRYASTTKGLGGLRLPDQDVTAKIISEPVSEN